jgi:hypothetical protein
LNNVTGISEVSYYSYLSYPTDISFDPPLADTTFDGSPINFPPDMIVLNASSAEDRLLKLVVTASAPNVDCPKSDTLKITVRAKPVFPQDLFPDILILCNALKDTIQLSSSLTNATYNYTTPNPDYLGLLSSGTAINNSIVVNPINTNASEDIFRNTSLIMTANNPDDVNTIQVLSCPSASYTLPIKIYANPPKPISTNSSNLNEICQGSTNIPFEVLPASNNNFNYNYTWINGAVELPNDSTINTTISFPNSGEQIIRVFRTNITSGCRSSDTTFNVSVANTNINELSNSCIFPTPAGNGLISVASDVTYLWGTIDCVSNIMNSPAANNSNQSFFPAGLPESTNDMGYWVELKREGCRTRIFYQVGCILDYIADELNTACPNSVSIEQMEVASQISAFPNPTSSSVTFSFKSIQEVPDQMLLINAQGRKVDAHLYKVSSEDKSLTADMSNLQDGLYLFILENQGGEKQAIRIIKQTY